MAPTLHSPKVYICELDIKVSNFTQWSCFPAPFTLKHTRDIYRAEVASKPKWQDKDHSTEFWLTQGLTAAMPQEWLTFCQRWHQQE